MDPVEAAHLLRRAEYVVRPERLAALTPLTREQAVDNVLAVETGVAIPSYVDHDIKDEGWQQWVYAGQWWLDRMTDCSRPVLEKMTWFWHGHFTSSWDKVNSAKAMTTQNKLFRDMALGNVRELAQAMALQPAMLYYLDNAENVASSPNQNFARELLELFTIGVGHYTEDDVTACARAWTGYNLNWDTEEYQYDGHDHDNEQKTFLGVTQNWNGPQIIDFLLQGNSTTKGQAAELLSRKLWKFFADDAPSTEVIQHLVGVLSSTMDIRPWVKALFMHDEFYSAKTRSGLVRSPIDFIVAANYYAGFRTAVTYPDTEMVCHPEWYVEGMGQVPFAPPNVSGWKTNGYWVNSSMMSARAEYARHLTWMLRHEGANDLISGPNDTLIPSDVVVDTLAARFGVTLCAETRDAMIAYSQRTRVSEPWGSWWESTNLLTMIMISPEFQQA